MQKYINQLVEDLEQIAKKPPAPFYIEPPAHMEEEPEIAELALVPYKTIEELTNIKMEAFPEGYRLTANLCNKVNKAIYKVFESLCIELVDAPPDIPPEILYDVLVSNWQHPVQYLPSSGMDLELCTGDPMTCAYGEYCNCDQEFDEYEIPNRFYDLLPKIADGIDAGLIIYLNPETLEMEEIPKSLMDNPHEFKLVTGYGIEDEELKHEGWDEYYKFEPLESHESFKIMESFADNMVDEKFRDQLYYALNHRKPFANFKWKIDNSQFRQDWFDFKQQWLENHVKQIIFSEINKLPDDYHEEINGFFDDDGTRIDPDTVPLPNLCVICKKHLAEDWEENLLCLMNRYDQRNDDDFKCGAFQKI